VATVFSGSSLYKIAPAHRQGIQGQVARDVTQDGLGHDHALWPAKAAKRRVALRVELAAVGSDLDVFQKISVVGMKYRPVCYRARQVGAEAAVRRHHQPQAAQPACGIVKARGVVVAERVAFAGDHEVVVAVQSQLDRALQLGGCDRGPHGQVPRLRLLAAKATAQAAALHAHRVVVQSQRVRHPVLYLTRVLGAAVDQPLVLLLRHRIGDLAFQIKMLLAADFEVCRAGYSARVRSAASTSPRRTVTGGST
jgi:hypothetical protein